MAIAPIRALQGVALLRAIFFQGYVAEEFHAYAGLGAPRKTSACRSFAAPRVAKKLQRHGPPIADTKASALRLDRLACARQLALPQ